MWSEVIGSAVEGAERAPESVIAHAIQHAPHRSKCTKENLEDAWMVGIAKMKSEELALSPPKTKESLEYLRFTLVLLSVCKSNKYLCHVPQSSRHLRRSTYLQSLPATK